MIGKILGNRYELIEQIGGGGMALVYRAKCNLLNRYVAIKILRDEFIEDEEFVAKFKRESQAVASMSHPNILNVYDVGVEEIEDRTIHYIVMEYIKGNTLKELIKNKGKLSQEETIYYSLQIAQALKHAHLNNIVHRDIKPQNIMITEDNRIKVTDFGIATAVSTSTIINSSNVLGSVHYSSPEQFRGGYVDEKSDIYSLGIVMYEMITGKIPFNGESPITIALKHSQEDIVPPREIDNTVSKNMEAIILKAVEKRQGDRYENISLIIKDLEALKRSGRLFINRIKEESEYATQVIPIVKDGDVDNMKKTNPNKKKSRPDNGSKMILLAVFLAFLLVSSIFFGYTRLMKFLDVTEVLVPNLIGKEEDEARTELEDLGLKLNVIGRVKNSELPEGQIVNQSSEKDSKVNKGFTIDVNLSEGQGLIKVPGLVNRTLEEAEKILKDRGLGIGSTKYEASVITPIDVVMKQEPEALEYLEPGSKVNLIISKGEEITIVIMPQLVGLDIIEAKSIILDKNLAIGEVVPHPSEDHEIGLVTWQSYEFGSELESRTAVDLYVSGEPEDDESISEETEATDLKEISFNLIPFTDRESTEIRIMSKIDGKSKEEYKKSHKGEDGDVLVKLKGKVGTEFEVYFDDIYQFNQTIKE